MKMTAASMMVTLEGLYQPSARREQVAMHGSRQVLFIQGGGEGTHDGGTTSWSRACAGSSATASRSFTRGCPTRTTRAMSRGVGRSAGSGGPGGRRRRRRPLRGGDDPRPGPRRSAAAREAGRGRAARRTVRGRRRVAGRASCRATSAAAPGDVPVHVFHGLEDDTAPPAHADLYARAIPQAQVHRLPGRDHQLDNDLADVATLIRSLRS